MKQLATLLALLVLGAAATMGQQCTGYSAVNPQITVLTPAQVAANGGVTATFSVQGSDMSGMAPSHNLVVTPNTWIGYNWSSANGASAQYYYIFNGTRSSNYAWSLSGSSAHYWLPSTNDIGTWQLFFVVTDVHGNTTQDKVIVTVVAGSGASIVAEDAVDSNFYLQISSSFNEPSMQNACSVCQSNPNLCEGGRHTPYFSGIATNHSSGEQQSTGKRQAGGVVDWQTTLSGYGSVTISAVPGDTIDGSVEDLIACSALGENVFDSYISFRVEYGKVVAADLGHPPRPGSDGSSIYDVADICDNDSDPADWQPTVVHSFSGRHPYWWGVTSLFRAPDLVGAPWIPLSSILTDFNTQPGPISLAKMVLEGGAVPYPGPAPAFPVPGACTQYPKNVILTLGSGSIPFWPWNN